MFSLKNKQYLINVTEMKGKKMMSELRILNFNAGFIRALEMTLLVI